MAFNLDDYEPVADRIERFWKDHPEGVICTDLVHYDDKHFIVKAYAKRDGAETGRLADATGYAEEVIGSTNVNRTSALENCETSAIGRALANLGYAVKNRASREEMAKVQPEPRLRSGGRKTTPSESHETAPTSPANGSGGVSINRVKSDLLARLDGDVAKASVVWQAALTNFGIIGEVPENMVEALETYLKGLGTPV
jgi:hypothetical protein